MELIRVGVFFIIDEYLIFLGLRGIQDSVSNSQPPTAAQQDTIRQILLASFGDCVAKRVLGEGNDDGKIYIYIMAVR